VAGGSSLELIAVKSTERKSIAAKTMPTTESASITVALWQSLVTLALGYIPAAILGLLLGLLIGSTPLLCQIGKRVLQFPVAVPAVYVVLFLMITQGNYPTVIFSILFSSVWLIAIHTGLGLQKAFQHQLQFALAIPEIFLGLRLGLTAAWTALLTAEIVLAGVNGLGFYLWNAYQSNFTKEVVNGILVIFLVTFISDQLLDALGGLIKKAFKPPANPE
jgi:ABC-type nitrate/sulfonate/bicarbonate transport system permease component